VIVNLCCSKQYQDLTPYEIVPILAENGKYVASESTFYRVLKQEGLVVAKRPRRSRKDAHPDELKATAVNQLWSWDISLDLPRNSGQIVKQLIDQKGSYHGNRTSDIYS